MTDSNLGTYYCFFPVRDGERTIERVMDSLMRQTYPPSKIIAVNDGSTDGTMDILKSYQDRYPELVEMINTGSIIRDYTRIPQLWNMSLRRGYDYHMIAAGDVIFAPTYAEKILGRMKEKPKLVVCSGDYGTMRSSAPHGAGRFVLQSFFYADYEKYYAIVGYESEILERALMKGYEIAVVKDATFEHLDKLGHSHNFSEFGYAMKTMGYYPPYVLARFVTDFIYNKGIGKKGAFQMLKYYLTFKPQDSGYYSRFPEDICSYIRLRQKVYLQAVLKRKARKLGAKLLKRQAALPQQEK